jgi:phosphoribosylformylglycinamidine cyclo-ligase
VPAIFTWLAEAGGVPDDDMLRTFNMGIGPIPVVASAAADALLQALRAAGEQGAAVIGRVEAGTTGVRYS